MAEGIEVRTAKNGAKSYRASVWDNRERKRIHKTCHSLAEAKAWRADALIALRQGTLRTPDPSTVREAAEVWLEGAERGTVRDRSGRAYKPSTIRSYREKLTRYVLPALGTTSCPSFAAATCSSLWTSYSRATLRRRACATRLIPCGPSTAARSSATKW